ncbi:MAG: ATP-binding cassette domain-containing protein, partial [Pseudomonadales bacterium]|nr:ATP-binding cassette domain-containing protein [Pseudomonadales bacterium]
WRARHGMAYVPQGRRVFPTLTVDEHLRIMQRGKNQQWTRERIYDIFPRLAERRSNFGNRLSGGEQQMLAIGRALMIDPRLLILDEPTEGLAPVIVDHVVEILQQLSTEGIAILLVEQNLSVAAELADELSIMVNGKIIDHIPSSQLLHDETMQRKYLGISLDGH